MVNYLCCVPFCPTGNARKMKISRARGIKHPSLFRIPKTCSNCNNVFSTKRSLKEHIKKQICLESRSMFVCTTCDRSFVASDTLKRHLEEQNCCRSSRPTISNFICSNCNSLFSANKSLKRHLQDKVCFKLPRPVISVFACLYCNCSFSSKRNLQHHVEKQICQRNLDDSPNIVCTNCNKIFARIDILKRHVNHKICLEKAAPISYKFICSYCNKRFTRMDVLKRHVLNKACLKETKPISHEFKCSYCNNEFSTKQSLQRHEERQICLRADEKFSRSGAFRCSYCDNAFATKQSLQRHIDRTICLKSGDARLSGPEVFICSKCNGTFVTNESLQQHTDSRLCSKNSEPAPPKSNEELAEKWRKAIGRTDKKLNQYHKVCEFHFEKKLIIRHDRVLMPEDIVYECERFRPSLVKGAFPTIFPEAPPEGYKSAKKRRLETIFGDRFASASKDTTQKPQPAANQNDSVENILDDNRLDATENMVVELANIVNENSGIENICIPVDSYGDTTEDSVPDQQHTRNENPVIKNRLDRGQIDATKNTDQEQQKMNENPKTMNISIDSDADEAEDIERLQPIVELNASVDLPDDDLVVDNTALEGQTAGKHNPVTIWIKAEEEEEELEKEDDHDVDEFTSSSVIENFDDLVRKCKTIEFPDTRWTFATIGKNILITYWNSSFNCLKKIIIKHNLKMTAYVRDSAIIIDEPKVRDLDTVKNVVKKLHEFKECPYSEDKSIKWKCRGFLLKNEKFCPVCSVASALGVQGVHSRPSLKWKCRGFLLKNEEFCPVCRLFDGNAVRKSPD